MGLQAANKFRVQSTKDCPQKSVVEIMVALKKKKKSRVPVSSQVGKASQMYCLTWT